MAEKKIPTPDFASLFKLDGIPINSYISENLTPELAICIARMFFPEFMEYQNCILWKREQTNDFVKYFDGWCDSLSGDLGAIERMLNHSHIIEDYFGRLLDELNHQNIKFFITVLQSSWLSALQAQFPNREFKIDIDDDYVITFWQPKNGNP